ncbi:MAG TPA: ribonuclease HII [Gammaproteobacteria bacterium]|jgi:ribonuclease HII|nr:ribonuclease HII [Acidiferrobacteraceae bacterium]MDP6552363.1 ribonuclease HII [Arenicellales bacterium]MDP6790350.1 ribonuclease HII [Arenicellales bacterium]MDP6918176.1 ribonuclease HII [Arenicellales bacterium]HCX87554.1 ribonuclease HII [Gammaproteobacteria bacterium]|tara:strand:- start:7 stop:615 length:609 start_codon:yes stop_codon:yes gene_type:complete
MNDRLVAGVDEAGRGPLAGPVVAAAVVLAADYRNAEIRDSKKLSQARREQVCRLIRENAVAWSIGAASGLEIDNQNIHRATLVAMRRAVLGLPCTPDFVIVDGRFYPELPYPGSACVRADETESAVSAASILAKVFRDRYMAFLDRKYPEYGFCQHKGYATAMHLEVLQSYGPCPDHRRSFRPVASAIQTCPVPKPGEREQH